MPLTMDNGDLTNLNPLKEALKNMKENNPFDRKIEVQKGMSASIKDAAIELTDTLDLCWAAAMAVFEDKAQPEHALTLLPMFMERADAKRQQELIRYRENMDAELKPREATKRRKSGPPAR
jgi:hypothetical protein